MKSVAPTDLTPPLHLYIDGLIPDTPVDIFDTKYWQEVRGEGSGGISEAMVEEKERGDIEDEIEDVREHQEVMEGREGGAGGEKGRVWGMNEQDGACKRQSGSVTEERL